MRIRPRLAIVAASSAMLLVALAGCTPGADPTIASPSATGTADGDGDEKLPVTSVEETGVNEPPALQDGATSVILDVVMTKCDSGPGAVVAEGSVTNHQDGPRDIVLTASWSTRDNATTYARVSAVMKQVPPGASQGYEIKSTFDAPPDSAPVCSFTATAGALK